MANLQRRLLTTMIALSVVPAVAAVVPAWGPETVFGDVQPCRKESGDRFRAREGWELC